jgi:FkbM family methyltransferase
MNKVKDSAKRFIKKKLVKDPLTVLLNTPFIGRMSNEQRVAMTVSCRDTDYIPKVADAGKVKKLAGKRVQVLYNGLLVEADGYVGDWMTQIIIALKGHHEPQEEKVFFEVMKRIGPKASMIELGSYWSYYSLWFNKEVKNPGAIICCEPDDNNLALGERNAELNGARDNLTFVQTAAGSDDGKMIDIVMDSSPDKTVRVPIMSVDGLVKKYKIGYLDILHMDVQGVELDALKGALHTIKKAKLRFVFVSTHHYLFSGSPMTHGDCLKFIKDNGGHIIASHTIPESFSGDGLIVASFSDKDKDFTVDTSLNHVDQSLFRPYEEDLQTLIDTYRTWEPK